MPGFLLSKVNGIKQMNETAIMDTQLGDEGTGSIRSISDYAAVTTEEKIQIWYVELLRYRLGLREIRDEWNSLTTAEKTNRSHEELVIRVLGDLPVALVTINLSNRLLRRAFDSARKKSKNGTLSAQTLPLGQEFYNATRSKVSYVDAFENVLRKFFVRLNQKVLGAKYRRYGKCLRWVRVYENSTKKFNGQPATHVHMLVEVPAGEGFRLFKFIRTFRDLFSRLIYPCFFESNASKVLNIKSGRRDGNNSHPQYIVKQLVNWNVAADRVFTSENSERVSVSVA